MTYYPKLRHFLFLFFVGIAVAAVWTGTKPERSNAYRDEVDERGVAVVKEAEEWHPEMKERWFVGPEKTWGDPPTDESLAEGE